MAVSRGTLDRIEDGVAVVLLEERKSVKVAEKDLPSDAVPGSVLDVLFVDGEVDQVIHVSPPDEEKKKDLADRMSRLKKRSGGSRFKKK